MVAHGNIPEVGGMTVSYHFLLRDPELAPSLVPRDENLDLKTEVLMTQHSCLSRLTEG